MPPDNPGGNEEEENHMTLTELRDMYPDEVAQLEAEARATADHTEAINLAVQEERDRIAAIDEVAACFDPALVQAAKFGENPCTAAELAPKAAQIAARAGSKFLADAAEDAKASGADAVGAAPAEEAEDLDTPGARMKAARAAIKSIFNMKDKEE